MCKADEKWPASPAVDAMRGESKARTRAFWSIDAAFALVMAVAMFAIFSSMLHVAGMRALGGADDASGSLLSARFSSYALERMEGGKEVDLQSVIEQTGRKYASLQVGDEFAHAGEKNGTVYCTRRLHVRDGKLVKLEACIG